MQNSSFVVKNLNFCYSQGTFTLKSLSFSAPSCTIIGLFGPNGSGKSTLLKCLSGIYKNFTGAIWLDGENIATCKIKSLAKKISYVPQERESTFDFTVYDMIMMGRTASMNFNLMPSQTDKEMVSATIEQFKLSSIQDAIYSTLSGGQKQLVLIARAIAQDTKTIILDEPTSALDFKNQLNIWHILKQLSPHKTIIVCLHDPNQALWFCDNIILLNHGTLLDYGCTKTILSRENLRALFGDICRMQDGLVVPREFYS